MNTWPIAWIVPVCIAVVLQLQVQALVLQTELPLSGQVLSNLHVGGVVELGFLNFMGLNPGNTALIDAVYHVVEHRIQAPYQGRLPDASLYIMGVHPSQAGLVVRAQNMDDFAADLSVSYAGDLDLYLSAAEASWAPGTELNAGTHLRLPRDNTLIPLVGSGGILAPEPLTQGQPTVALDLAVQVSRHDRAGPKQGVLTFTVISQF